MGPLGIWAFIAMPLARPATAAVCLLTFVQYWSDFMNPLLYLNDPGARPRNSRAFTGEIPFIREVPVTEGWVDVEELAGEELARAYYGRAGVDDVIATATRRAAAFFKPSPEPARPR